VINKLILYFLYIFFSLIVYLINTYLGILLFVFSYLFIFFINYLENKNIFNFIQNYLLVSFILTFSKVYNINIFNVEIYSKEINYFLKCIFFTGIITFFFSISTSNVTINNRFNQDNVNKNHLYIIVILLSLFIFAHNGNLGQSIQYISRHLFFTLPIILVCLLYINFKSIKLLSYILFLYLFYFYGSTIINRSSFILVPIFFIIATFLLNQFNNQTTISLKTKIKMIFFFVIILILSDIYKSSGSLNILNFFKEIKINNLLNYYSNSRYKLFSDFEINNYFNILGLLIDGTKEQGGNLFSQFFNIFTPRYFFPEKETTNISQLIFIQKYSDNPLYFEIFIEASYNLKIVGVILFHFLILIIGNFMLKSLIYVRNVYLYQIFYINYLFYILFIFIIIRGPAIFFINYFLVYFIFMILTLIKNYKDSKNVK